MNDLLLWLQVTGTFLLGQLMQPYVAVGVGSFVGGFAMGASKNRTAFAEIGRSVFYGIVAGGAIWIIQRLAEGGGA